MSWTIDSEARGMAKGVRGLVRNFQRERDRVRH